MSNPNPQKVIADALAQRGWRRRTGKEQRLKLRGRCLFHEPDPLPSADFYPDDGFYFCFACGRRYTPEEVAQALGVTIIFTVASSAGANENGQVVPGRTSSQKPQLSSGAVRDEHYHSRHGWPSAVYTYKFPDGRLSHYKLRFDGERKQFAFQTPTFEWKRPDVFWPIFGDYLFPHHLNIVIVEGEKAQLALGRAQQSHQGIPISALTCGSAGDLKDPRTRATLIDRLMNLHPNRILVWPDNDKPGLEWAVLLHRQALALGLPIALVDTRALGLEPAQGADDYLDQGYSLDQIFEQRFQRVGGYNVDQIVEQTVVTKDERFMIFGTRKVRPITTESVELQYLQATGQGTTPPQIAKRLRNEFRIRAIERGVDLYYRRWHDEHRTSLCWRPSDLSDAYHLSAAGERYVTDPPDSLLILPEGKPRYSGQVDKEGDRRDLEDLCRLFDLDDISISFIEGWLICAFLGAQTPILYLRGEAGSGKTTLARALIGIIEPTVPAISLATGGRQSDTRALIEGARQSIAVLLDNVSGFNVEAEDLLCQFVTGFSILHRQLYENKVENLSMQRAICITTTNWDVSKGDLNSRIVPIRMLVRDKYRDDVQVDKLVQPLIPPIRGYLFRRIQQYYLNAAPNSYSSLRAADIAKIWRSLSYDADRLSMALVARRGAVASETDSWFNAICAWVQSLEIPIGHYRDVKLEELRGVIDGLSGGFIPSEHRLGAFLNEALTRFRDRGFTIQNRRDKHGRWWRITCLSAMPEPEGDD